MLIFYVMKFDMMYVYLNTILVRCSSCNIGSLQGDALSPISFAIYLEAAIRGWYAKGLVRPNVDTLPEVCRGCKS
jgi:hypothetical protein